MLGLLTCDWGRVCGQPDDLQPCDWQAVQRMVLHRDEQAVPVQLCATHRDRMLAATKIWTAEGENPDVV